MTSRRRNLFVILFMLGLLAASGVLVAVKETRLGLDLKGGVELVYQGEPTPQSKVTGDAINRSIDVMRDRVDKFGVAEPEISRLGNDQISVGLPDVKNAKRAAQNVGSTAQLYFYDWERSVVGNPDSPIPNLYDAILKASRQKPVQDSNNTTGDQFYLCDPRARTCTSTRPDTSRKDLLSEYDGKLPKGKKVLTVPPGTVVVLGERPDNVDSDQPFHQYFVLHDNPELKGADIKNPKQSFDPQSGQPDVTMEFSKHGREVFHEVTRRLAQRGQQQQIPGQPPKLQTFAVILDGEVKSRASIDFQQYPDGIDGRTGAQISGLDLNEAQDLAKVLQTGALPITLKLISQTQVSATLGKQALKEGLIAGGVGFVLVLLFLLLLYRLLGLIAGIALVTYGILFFALIKLIPITLTLPGIAGLILTIGVAADSNIVIFERIKEELRAGRSTLSAIAAGYGRGIKTIVDANVVTLITAFILFVLATSGVKGFAFTLGVGTLVSLLTAVVFTQAVLGTMGRSRLLRSPAMLGVGRRTQRWRFDFIGRSKYFFSMSGIILTVGAIAISTSGLNLGIDFEGGTRVTSALNRPASVEDVRNALAPLGLDDAEIQSVKNKELGENVVQISTEEIEPNETDKLQRLLDQKFGIPADGFSSNSVGATFGSTVARSAVYAIIFSLIAIMSYVAFRFEPKFAVPVLIALFHDLLITAGVYSLTDREVTTSTVAALLTILGFSLYDTVIVFDRIRENAPRMPRATFSQIVNRSMAEVLNRSLATSFSTLLPVTALLLFGGETLKDFAFALLVGIASGTYSSIFIASPVLTAWKEREPAYEQRRRRIVADLGLVPAFAVATTSGPAAASPAAVRAEPDGHPEPELEPALVEDGEPNGELDIDDRAQLVETHEPAGIASEAPAGDGAERAREDAAARAARAERAERKKRSKAKSSRRKHGRRR
jgi:SecD/SecF fusion protein